jgi:hypothetical protein
MRFIFAAGVIIQGKTKNLCPHQRPPPRSLGGEEERDSKPQEIEISLTGPGVENEAASIFLLAEMRVKWWRGGQR